MSPGEMVEDIFLQHHFGTQRPILLIHLCQLFRLRLESLRSYDNRLDGRCGICQDGRSNPLRAYWSVQFAGSANVKALCFCIRDDKAKASISDIVWHHAHIVIVTHCIDAHVIACSAEDKLLALA